MARVCGGDAMRSEHGDWSVHGRKPGRSGTSKRVIVAGAGLSGLVTARLLKDSGFDVTVLEARNRIGGRIWTDDSLGVPIDLGGSWIHGAEYNPLKFWCHTLGVPLIESPRGNFWLYENGQEIDFYHLGWYSRRAIVKYGIPFVRKWLGIKWRILFGLNGDLTFSVPIARLLRKANPSFGERALLWMISMVEAIEGTSVTRLSMRAWNPLEYRQTNLIPKPGFRPLLQDAAKGLNIEFGTEIKRIDWSGTGVIFETNRGTFGSDLAVISLPLGVLKQHPDLFYPRLPSTKQRAIEQLGYDEEGVLNKIVLRFRHRFWRLDRDRFGYLPDSPQERGLFNYWIEQECVTGAPILVGFSSGPIAVKMDREYTDEEILREALRALRRIFGRELPPVEGFRVTRWLSDPYSRGAYSYAATGNRSYHRYDLAEPVEGKIFFVGEATEDSCFGTVHAAVVSAEREARRIHRLYCCEEEDLGHLPWKNMIR